MTLSGTGDADTPAGGSVCMRYRWSVSKYKEGVWRWRVGGGLTLKSRIKRRRAAVDMMEWCIV